MPPPLVPWEPSHVPLELQEEIDRRRKNISLEFVNPGQGSWQSGDWKKYKGPMTSWARVCSNGAGPVIQGGDGSDHPVRPRFVFFGGKDFASTYGFKRIPSMSPNSQIIGYMPDGTPHVIDNERTAQHPIHVPTPEIVRIDTTIQKEILRRTVIEWVCFSWKQLEYMTPYFLVPGISVMIEFGWNHFNPKSLVEIEKENTMVDLWNNPLPLYNTNIIDSRGNYDVTYGIITNFNWSVEGNNRYVCTTEITSKNRLYAGLPISSEIILRGKKDKKETEFKMLGNLGEFLLTKNIVLNFSEMARFGPKSFVQGSKGIEVEVESVIPPASQSPLVTSARAKPVATQTINIGKFDISRTFFSFFLDVYNKTLAIKDPKERNLKLSYLYGVFDGRGVSEQTSKDDFDHGAGTQAETTWFSMGLITTLINIFSERASMGGAPMFELNIDDVLISAHDNLISADGDVMLIPNAKAPKYFVGQEGLDDRSVAYQKQYIESTDVNNQTIADKHLAKLFKMLSNDPTSDDVLSHSNQAARDDHDIWINRNVYRLNKEAANTTQDNSYEKPDKGSRAFANPASGQIAAGYLRDIYVNVGSLIKLVGEMVKEKKSYYDLVQVLLSHLNKASAGFWNLNLTDSTQGHWTVADYNFSSSKNAKNQDKVLIFDMHDANNIIKSFKFRPQLTDAQANRVLYGEASNPASQLYSKDEVQSLDWEFKDVFFQNTVESRDKSLPSKDQKLEETWKYLLRDIQTVGQGTRSTYQMTISRKYYPEFETKDVEKYPIRYIKFALPKDNGVSILRKMVDDNDYETNSKYCAIQPGINAEITFQGLGGLRTFQCFLIKNLPRPYSHDKIAFQIINVIDHVEGGNWETTIVAGIRPLRKYLRDTLRLKDVT